MRFFRKELPESPRGSELSRRLTARLTERLQVYPRRLCLLRNRSAPRRGPAPTVLQLHRDAPTPTRTTSSREIPNEDQLEAPLPSAVLCHGDTQLTARFPRTARDNGRAEWRSVTLYFPRICPPRIRLR